MHPAPHKKKKKKKTPRVSAGGPAGAAKGPRGTPHGEAAAERTQRRGLTSISRRHPCIADTPQRQLNPSTVIVSLDVIGLSNRLPIATGRHSAAERAQRVPTGGHSAAERAQRVPAGGPRRGRPQTLARDRAGHVIIRSHVLHLYGTATRRG